MSTPNDTSLETLTHQARAIQSVRAFTRRLQRGMCALDLKQRMPFLTELGWEIEWSCGDEGDAWPVLGGMTLKFELDGIERTETLPWVPEGPDDDYEPDEVAAGLTPELAALLEAGNPDAFEEKFGLLLQIASEHIHDELFRVDHELQHAEADLKDPRFDAIVEMFGTKVASHG
jgi:hypothetical protein